MPTTHRDPASAAPRIDALLARHAELEHQIHRELQRPSTSEDMIRELKMRKLRLKDEIEFVRSGTAD